MQIPQARQKLRMRFVSPVAPGSPEAVSASAGMGDVEARAAQPASAVESFRKLRLDRLILLIRQSPFFLA